MRHLLVAMLLAPIWAPQPVERVVSVRFDFGVGARNHLDTVRGLYTHDMVCDPPVTVPMQLTDEDAVRILAAAHAVAFFAPPRESPPASTAPAACWKVPCTNWHLEIHTNLRSNSLSWDDCNCGIGPDGERGKAAASAVDAAIRANPAFAALPKPRCGYL